MVVNNRLGYLFVFLGMSMALYAQRKTEVIRYGDLDQWVVRKITESAIIGKETKTLYCVGPTDTIIGNRPFESKASPWGSSNVMARVSGITKASVSVYPERRDEGYCARLETGIESISAMGIMNVKVLVGMPLSRPFSGTGEEFFGDVGTDRLRYPVSPKTYVLVIRL